jgi:integrase
MTMGKRDYGSGSIEERGPGRYRIEIQLGRDPETGKPRRRRFTVRGTKRDAQTAVREALAERDTGGIVDPEGLTVGEWLTRWLERHIADGHVGPRTAERYRGIVRRQLIASIGAISLQDLRRQQIADLKDTLGAKLAPATVRKVLGLLRQALDAAVEGELLSRNPASAVRSPSVKDARERRALDADEITLLLAAAEGTEYDVPLRFALATGIRQAELLGATWGSLDLEAGTFTVERTVQHVAGEFLSLAPKTKRSRRTIELSPATVSLLRRHRSDQLEARLRVGSAWSDHDLVFPDALGRFCHRRSFYGGFRQLVAESGIVEPESVTWHSLRHSAASLWIRAGVDLLTVSRRLGHASAAFTMDSYGHLVAGQQAAAAAAMDHLIG